MEKEEIKKVNESVSRLSQAVARPQVPAGGNRSELSMKNSVTVADLRAVIRLPVLYPTNVS